MEETPRSHHSGIHINEKWFKYDQNYKFNFTCRDDLDEYCDRSNMQLHG